VLSCLSVQWPCNVLAGRSCTGSACQTGGLHLSFERLKDYPADSVKFANCMWNCI